MKIRVAVGRTEGFESSFNLFFENGLRLMTPDLKWVGTDEKARIKEQFNEVLEALTKAGFNIEGIRLV